MGNSFIEPQSDEMWLDQDQEVEDFRGFTVNDSFHSKISIPSAVSYAPEFSGGASLKPIIKQRNKAKKLK